MNLLRQKAYQQIPGAGAGAGQRWGRSGLTVDGDKGTFCSDGNISELDCGDDYIILYIY